MSSSAARPAGSRSRWIRWVALLVVVAGIGATAAWWFGWRSKDQQSAGAASATTIKRVVAATTGTVTDTVAGTGTVAAATTDALSFTSSGKVTAVNVAVGDTVTAGQVLATIDPTELQSAYDAALATVATAQAKLDDDTDADASDEQIAADNSSLKVAYDAAVTASAALAGASLTATTDGTVTAVNLTVDQQLGSGGSSGTTVSGSGTGGGATPRAVGSSTGTGQSGSTGSSSTTSTAQIEVVSTGKYTVDLSVDTSDIAKVATGQAVDLSISTSTSSTTANQTTRNFPGGGAFPTGGAFPGRGVPDGRGAPRRRRLPGRPDRNRPDGDRWHRDGWRRDGHDAERSHRHRIDGIDRGGHRHRHGERGRQDRHGDVGRGLVHGDRGVRRRPDEGVHRLERQRDHHHVVARRRARARAWRSPPRARRPRCSSPPPAPRTARPSGAR